MIHVAALPALLVWCGVAYNLLAIAAGLRFRRRKPLPDYHPPVSILKPVHGRDPLFYEAILSHGAQRFPQFEILFGVAEPDDPAIADIERLRREFPNLAIRLVDTANAAPNRKVGCLEILAREASYDVLLVNDADILVAPDYLEHVVSLLEDDNIGLVTCLYRGRGSSVAARAEALGVATEFAPSVLVARLVSSSGFALGSTMAFRRRELADIGGFHGIREYLADDYQLGARISALGKRIAMADTVVETNLGAGTWRDVWKHQVRWSRTIRISRPAGYFGYAVTQVTFWSVVAAACGYPKTALAGLTIRFIAASFALRLLDAHRPRSAAPDNSGTLPRVPRGTSSFRASSSKAKRKAQLALVPLRDLLGFAVWCAGLAGNRVEWRGRRYRVLPDGRMRIVE